jgi:hypothetical protein
MDKELLSNNGDNLYKYVIIIGLSLLLISPMLNNNRMDAILKQIDVENAMRKSIETIDEQTKIVSEMRDENQKKSESHTKNIQEIIKKMNIYNLDGSQIETPEELLEFYIYLERIIKELYNDINNNGDSKIIEEKINKLLSLLGSTKNLEDAIKNLDELEIQLNNINNILAEWNKELAEISLSLDKIKAEGKRLKDESLKLNIELEKIAIQRKHYENENIINNIFRIIGAIMVIIGIFFWYINIQRYIDIEYRK